ncbi:HAD family hydrolase [Nocardioides terrisoli]|uniref:HAD family hydrolase n=1 Tax=Nocardioides terrisoli TaxID=3388267 RepID=UPI00287B7C50|nr:HAD family hydrolase [Nocardioides marmorisolisilvae]
MIRLVATDLDGTLLRSDLTVSRRTRAALDRVRAAGVPVVPVTARQPIGLAPIAAEAGFEGWALCGNGAHGLHLSTGETLFEAHLDVAVQQALAEALSSAVPDLLFVSVRERGDVFVAQHGYAAMASFSDHKRDPATMAEHSLADVLAEPSLKLVVRHASLPNDELVATIRGLGLAGFEVTHSGAPFVEVLAQGVTKAWGLDRLCRHLGVDRAEVLAFGDAPNDAEMLAWAGRGVAVANAAPETLAAAGETTLSNEEDGVAAVLEALLPD